MLRLGADAIDILKSHSLDQVTEAGEGMEGESAVRGGDSKTAGFEQGVNSFSLQSHNQPRI